MSQRRTMRDNAIRARSRRKYKAATDSDHGLPVSDNRLNRDFQPGQPDRVWSGDITYIATQEGWLYLAVVIDLFSRQVVGWALGDRMTGTLVIDALANGLVPAPAGRRPDLPLRSRLTICQRRLSEDLVRLRHAWIDEPAWQLLGTRQGQRSYNAVTETLFGSLKVERLHGMRFETRRQAKDEVIDWLTFYNRNRMHSTLGYMDPMTFEEVWRRQQNTQAA